VSAESELQRALAGLYAAELERSRLIWRIEADARLDPPWTSPGIWCDPAGALLVDLSDHPTLGADPPWYQAEATDADALELLCAIRLPAVCEVLLPSHLVAVLARLGATEPQAELVVLACAPGELGEAALPYQPIRLGTRHRHLVAGDHWRPEDLTDEMLEEHGGTRWGLVRDGQLGSGLLAEKVSNQVRELADVHTRPELRRRGFGAALVQGVVRRLHERGLTATYTAHPSNLPSLALAARCGFREVFRWQRVRLRRD